MIVYIFKEFKEMTHYGDEGNLIPDIIADIYKCDNVALDGTSAVLRMGTLMKPVCLKALCDEFNNNRITFSEYQGKDFVIIECDIPEESAKLDSLGFGRTSMWVTNVPLSAMVSYVVCRWQGENWQCQLYRHNSNLMSSFTQSFTLGGVTEDYVETILPPICPKYYVLDDVFYMVKKETKEILLQILEDSDYDLSDCSFTTLEQLSGGYDLDRIIGVYKTRKEFEGQRDLL